MNAKTGTYDQKIKEPLHGTGPTSLLFLFKESRKSLPWKIDLFVFTLSIFSGQKEHKVVSVWDDLPCSIIENLIVTNPGTGGDPLSLVEIRMHFPLWKKKCNKWKLGKI